MKYVWEAKDITAGLVALNPETNLPAFIVGIELEASAVPVAKRGGGPRRWRLTSLVDGHIYPAKTAIELAEELTELGAKAAPGHHPDYYLELIRNTQETTRPKKLRDMRVLRGFDPDASRVTIKKPSTKTYGRPTEQH